MPGRGEDRPGSWLTAEETELFNLLQSESDRERVTSELLNQVIDDDAACFRNAAGACRLCSAPVTVPRESVPRLHSVSPRPTM